MKSKLEKYSKVIANRLKQYNEEALEAVVHSPFALKDSDLTRIKGALEKRFNTQINLVQRLNQTLIAGIAIEVASEFYDASLRKKLNQVINLNEEEGV